MSIIAPLKQSEVKAVDEDYGKFIATVGKAVTLLAKEGLPKSAWDRLINDAAMRARLVTSWKAGGIVSLDQTLEDWARLYQDDFGLKVDLNKLAIPQYSYGFSRLVVVAQGLTPNRAYDVCAKKFSCWRCIDDLDMPVKGRNDREPTTDYAIWVRDRVEADEELKNLSADQLKEQQVSGITLLERLVLELKYFAETGEHLDRANATLCSGSCASDGSVPSVSWYDKLEVDWYHPDNADDRLRSRQVVS